MAISQQLRERIKALAAMNQSISLCLPHQAVPPIPAFSQPSRGISPLRRARARNIAQYGVEIGLPVTDEPELAFAVAILVEDDRGLVQHGRRRRWELPLGPVEMIIMISLAEGTGRGTDYLD